MKIMTIKMENETTKSYRITDEDTQVVKRFLNIVIDDYNNNFEMILDDNAIQVEFQDTLDIQDF